MTGVAVVWLKVGTADVALRDCAEKTFHCALGSLGLLAVVPHHEMSTLPAAPAAIHAPIAVLVPAPLLTRTGVVQVAPWFVEAAMNTLVPLENVTCLLYTSPSPRDS